MKRESFLLILLAASALFSCRHEAELPNIVILYADDMGYGDASCYNPESKITTPNIDRLAQEGIRFTDGHSSSGICTPSRFALLTGQYHWRRFHGIVGPFGPSKFVEGDYTLPEMLHDSGYKTACIGKWHLGWDWEAIKKQGEYDWNLSIPDGPTDHGFDYYFGDGTINFPPYTFVENDRVVEVPSEPFNLRGMETKEGNWEFRPGPMAKDWDPYQVLPTLMEKAVDYIEDQDGEEPFFLYLPFTSPHAPIIPNDEFDGKSAAGAFGDFVFETDYVIGKVIGALDHKGFTDNTLVVFTADNGPEYYAYPRIQNYEHSSMGHLRGLKRDIYEGGHRVPFIIKWPDHIQPGQVSDALIHQVDLYRTIYAILQSYSIPDLIRDPIPDTIAIDGINQLPYLIGETNTPLRTQAVQNTYADGFVMRKDHWVLIERFSGYHREPPAWYLDQNGYEKANPDNPGELYDIRVDPSQRINLFDSLPDKVSELSKILEREKNRQKMSN